MAEGVQAPRADAGVVYERVRRDFVGLLASCSEQELATPVPATPEWRVRDVLAHVVGLAADLDAQRFPEPDDEGGVAWSAAQVRDRAGCTISDLAAEWDREGPVFAEGLRVFGYELGCHFVADLVTHLADVRQALGRGADPRDPEAVAVSLDHYLQFLHEQLVAVAWGVVEIRTGGEVRSVGGPAGPPRALLEAQPFDALRSFSARRSAAQVRSLAWTGDGDGLVAFLQVAFAGGYSIPDRDLAD